MEHTQRQPITTTDLDRLTRRDEELDDCLRACDVKDNCEAPGDAALWRIQRLLREPEPPLRSVHTSSGPFGDNRFTSSLSPSRAAIASLYEGQLSNARPIVFSVECRGEEIAVRLGTWFADECTSGQFAATESLFRSAFLTSYPGITLGGPGQCETPGLSGLAEGVFDAGGFALGVPQVRTSSEPNNRTEIDQVIRSMGNGDWAFLILAEPIDSASIRTLRNFALRKLREVRARDTKTRGVACSW